MSGRAIDVTLRAACCANFCSLWLAKLVMIVRRFGRTSEKRQQTGAEQEALRYVHANTPFLPARTTALNSRY
jgi:hypothetical protein